MQFLKDIKQSIYSPSYYQQLWAKPFSYSLKYFVLFVLVVSFITAIVFSVWATPRVKMFLENINNKVINYYPAELVINIKNGKASTNVAEPYFIKMPDDVKNDKDFENALVINTIDNVTIEQFKSYKTAVLLTKDSLVAYGDNGKISISPLDKISDFSVNKPKIEAFAGKIKPFLSLAYPALFLGAWSASFFALLFKLMYLLFGALVIWLVLKLKKINLEYKKSYQLGLHLMTTGILLTGIINLVSLYSKSLNTLPFLFTIVLIVMTVVNIKKVEQMPIS